MKCPRCGKRISKTWLKEKSYCPNCGAELVEKGGRLIATTPKAEKAAPTKLWYLAPLILHILGGLLGYVGVKGRDEKMARKLLIVGVVVFGIEAAIGFLLIYYGVLKF